MFTSSQNATAETDHEALHDQGAPHPSLFTQPLVLILLLVLNNSGDDISKENNPLFRLRTIYCSFPDILFRGQRTRN